MVKKWNFEEEGESIQWACLGEPEKINSQNTSVSHSVANYTSIDSLPTPPVSHDRLMFINLWSFHSETDLLNGMDYTFSPSRKAWPISPHGVIIQRVFELERTEIVKADLSGDAVLPTIFSVNQPLF